jgi:hypothetical protein
MPVAVRTSQRQAAPTQVQEEDGLDKLIKGLQVANGIMGIGVNMSTLYNQKLERDKSSRIASGKHIASENIEFGKSHDEFDHTKPGGPDVPQPVEPVGVVKTWDDGTGHERWWLPKKTAGSTPQKRELMWNSAKKDWDYVTPGTEDATVHRPENATQYGLLTQHAKEDSNRLELATDAFDAARTAYIRGSKAKTIQERVLADKTLNIQFMKSQEPNNQVTLGEQAALGDTGYLAGNAEKAWDKLTGGKEASLTDEQRDTMYNLIIDNYSEKVRRAVDNSQLRERIFDDLWPSRSNDVVKSVLGYGRLPLFDQYRREVGAWRAGLGGSSTSDGAGNDGVFRGGPPKKKK